MKSTEKNDGIAFHHHLTGHKIDFQNVEIIAEEKNYWRRLIIEGLEIRKLGENKAKPTSRIRNPRVLGPNPECNESLTSFDRTVS